MRSMLASLFGCGLVGVFSACSAAADVTAPTRKASDACAGFAWSVANERAWFARQDLRSGASGIRLSRIDRAVELTLEPSNNAHFFLPPAKAPSPGTFSGGVTFFGVPRPGLYQVTVSRNAAIDVFENGTRIAAAAESNSKDCQGVRRSERFDLSPGGLVLVQISGATQPTIKIAFEPAP